MFEDILTLGAGHSMMTGHCPNIIGLQKFSNDFFKATKAKDTMESFGLFGSDLNYNTYYPDVTKEDLNPNEEEFIEPIFRMLSECIVAKSWSPTDFSKPGVLKASMPLLLGQTVNCDHETNIGNAIGSVKQVTWQEAYTETVGGKKIFVPAGINASLKIDAKANPRIARGILMDPPSVHSNSVTVRFAWEKSHQELGDDEFWDKMGSYDKDGQMIRKVVTKIIGYYETSLVSHGADPYAQKIGDDGKIINPVHADNTSKSFSDKPRRNNYVFNDFKDILKEEVLHNTMVFNIENNNGPQGTTNNKNNNIMNEELKAFLQSLFGTGLLTLSEGSEPTQEIVVSALKELVSSKTALTTSLSTITAERDTLSAEVVSLKNAIEGNKTLVAIGTQHLSDVRKEVTENYSKLMGEGKIDESMVTLIASADITTLTSLGASYKTQLEDKFPLTCSDCGSANVNRSSSTSESEGGDDKNKEILSNSEVLQRLRKDKMNPKS